MRTGHTDRLTIEPLTVAHADELAGLLDARVNAHFAPGDAPTALDELRQRFVDMIAGSDEPRPGELFLNFAVRLAGTGACIGRLEAFVQGEDAEVAFLFVPDAWGFGFASNAVEWLREHLAGSHGVQRLWACITPTNERSIALCRRAGFTPAPPDRRPNLASYDDGDVVLSRPSTVLV